MSYRYALSVLRAALALVFISGASASAKVLQWTCAYPKVSNPNGVTGDQGLTLTFTVDDVNGKATVVGNAGKSGVEVFAEPGSITFLDRLPGGAIQITSIDKSGHSVHSRHRLIGGQLLPSQSYGRCVTDPN